MFGISKRLKREFETAIVNEPSVFEPLKFDSIWSTNVSDVYYYIKGYTCSFDPFTIFISFKRVYMYLKLLISKLNFLVQKIYFEISVLWDDF